MELCTVNQDTCKRDGICATVFPPLQAALGLPRGHQCYGAMMIGTPKFAYCRLPARKTPVIDWRL